MSIVLNPRSDDDILAGPQKRVHHEGTAKDGRRPAPDSAILHDGLEFFVGDGADTDGRGDDTSGWIGRHALVRRGMHVRSELFRPEGM